MGGNGDEREEKCGCGDNGTNGSNDFLYKLWRKRRVVCLFGPIIPPLSDIVVYKLLTLAIENPKKDIVLIINSPGGMVVEGLAIHDVMQTIKPDVATICIGHATSMGAVLLAAGTKNKRFILPNAKTMIHQPSGGMEGTAAQLERQNQEMKETTKRICEILSKHTGQTVEKITKDIEQDHFMSAKEALVYGLVDKILAEKGSLSSLVGMNNI